MGILGRSIISADRGAGQPEPQGGGRGDRNVGGREAGKPDQPQRDDEPEDRDESTERNVGG
jgi:hypothetical protein